MIKKILKPRLYSLEQIQDISQNHNLSLMTMSEGRWMNVPKLTVSVAEDADPFGVFTAVGKNPRLDQKQKFTFTLYYP